MNGINIRIALLTLLLLMTGCTPRYLTLHEKAFVADTHCDVLLRVMNGENITVATTSGHTDLPRMKQGGVDLEVFILWVDPYRFLPVGAYDRAHEMIDSLESVARRSQGRLRIVTDYDDIIQNEKEGVISALIGLEGGHGLENDLNKLDALYDRGLRYLGLTWNNSTDWATSAKDETQSDSLAFRGLTDLGREIVRHCNDKGILVDVSHAGEQTFWDVMATTTKPVIASHSCVYNLCPHFRNLTDDQLQALKVNGGVVFINFYPGYLDSTFADKAKSVEAKYGPQLDSLKNKYGAESDEYWYGSMDLMADDLQAVAPDVDAIIDHIDYVARLIGVDHVGLGSDFDGVEALPRGMEDVTRLPVITKKLLARGYSPTDVRKILGGNFLRVFREVRKENDELRMTNYE